jgi:hypothetical protein
MIKELKLHAVHEMKIQLQNNDTEKGRRSGGPEVKGVAALLDLAQDAGTYCTDLDVAGVSRKNLDRLVACETAGRRQSRCAERKDIIEGSLLNVERFGRWSR